jgi:hypothetical protein
MRITSNLLLLSLAAAATQIGAEPAKDGFFAAPSVGVELVQTSNPFPDGIQTSNPFPKGADDVADLEGVWFTAKGDPRLIDHWSVPRVD